MLNLLQRIDELARFEHLQDTLAQRKDFVKRVMADALEWAAPDGPWAPRRTPDELRRIASLLRTNDYVRDHDDLERATRLSADGKRDEAWELLREVLKRHPWKPERVPEERPRE